MKHAVFGTRLRVTGTSLTASFVSMGTFTDDVTVLWIFNSCNQPIEISFDGTNVHFELDGESFVFDFKANDRQMKKSLIYARHRGVVPTSGSVRVSAEVAARA